MELSFFCSALLATFYVEFYCFPSLFFSHSSGEFIIIRKCIYCEGLLGSFSIFLLSFFFFVSVLWDLWIFHHISLKGKMRKTFYSTDLSCTLWKRGGRTRWGWKWCFTMIASILWRFFIEQIWILRAATFFQFLFKWCFKWKLCATPAKPELTYKRGFYRHHYSAAIDNIFTKSRLHFKFRWKACETRRENKLRLLN